MNRRDFGKLTTVAAFAAVLRQNATAQQAQTELEKEHAAMMKKYENLSHGANLKIAMLVYPDMFLQDLIGPLTVFEALMNREIYLVWKRREPIGYSNRAYKTLIPVTPTATFAECPADLDVLFVPGGVPGTITMMQDREVLQFLADKARTAKFVTSVCTGSLILGAAGLLKGYKATSHWATRDVLSEFGAIPINQRIVTDRNRVTGGGVTAGIDFGLTLAAKLRGETYAKAVQLYLEYAPQPPFNSGTPETAGNEEKAFINEMLQPFAKAARKIAKSQVRVNLR